MSPGSLWAVTEARHAISQMRAKYPLARIVADYTGGTKSMTAGLVAAAIDDPNCELSIVGGMRKDLVKVASETALVKPIPVSEIRLIRRVDLAKESLQRFDYASAEKTLSDAARLSDSSSFRQLTDQVALCRGFDAWDRFKYEQASQCFAGISSATLGPYKAFLNVLLRQSGHGFEMVEDLLLNVQRRASQDRYDDAVSRMYRAIELTAQTWLRMRYGLETGDLDASKVSEALRNSLPHSTGGKIKIGLLESWKLIGTIPDDPLADIYEGASKKLLTFLTIRNESLLAHGTTPIDKNDFKAHYRIVTKFISDVVDIAVAEQGNAKRMSAVQFPTEF